MCQAAFSVRKLRGQIFCFSGTNNTEVNTAVMPSVLLQRPHTAEPSLALSPQTPQSCWEHLSILLEVFSCGAVAFQSYSMDQQIPETLYNFLPRRAETAGTSQLMLRIAVPVEAQGVGEISLTLCTRETHQELFRVCLLKVCSEESPLLLAELPSS